MSSNVIEILNDLVENSRDGEYGFRTCAERVKSAHLRQLFNDRSAHCAQAAQELSQLISRLGGKPAQGGSATGALHRGWVQAKSAVGADSDESLLEECERGEDAAVARYRKALKAELPPEVRAVVQRQADGTQRNHDHIKRLRDEARMAHSH